MGQKMTWEEMKRIYPDEWLLIIDMERDRFGHLISGVVARHSKDDLEIFRAPALKKDCAFKYTGESQFPVGLDFFRRFRTTIDYAQGQLITEPL